MRSPRRARDWSSPSARDTTVVAPVAAVACAVVIGVPLFRCPGGDAPHGVRRRPLDPARSVGGGGWAPRLPWGRGAGGFPGARRGDPPARGASSLRGALLGEQVQRAGAG